MKIVIKKDARNYYIARQNAHRQPVNWQWADILEQVQGETLEVETAYLFKDQYNTAPIPGVSDNGLRIMQESVEAVIDDVRPGNGRCNWCGKWGKMAETCEHCGQAGYMEAF